MSALFNAAVRWRRLVARRPWVYWIVIAALAALGAASVHRRIEDVDAARRAWGDTERVLVTTTPSAPGQPIVTEVARVPTALVPHLALAPADRRSTLIARHAIASNQIVTQVDVGRGGVAGPLALVPDGWLVVAIVESPGSGAAPGDRVVVASDGVVLAPDAIVVGHHDEVTLVAAPAGAAPLLPAAAAGGALALLLRP